MGLGQGPPAYLAPLAHDAPKTKVHWESPRFLFVDLEVPAPTRHWTHFLCCTLLYIYYPPTPRSANSTSFKLQDGCLLNELTLCIFDSGDWWSTSLRMTWHKGAFCWWFFCLFLVFFLLSFVSCFLISFSKVEVPLRASFSIQLLFFFFSFFYSLWHTIFYTSTIYLPLVPAPSFYPQPSLRTPALPVLQQI